MTARERMSKREERERTTGENACTRVCACECARDCARQNEGLRAREGRRRVYPRTRSICLRVTTNSASDSGVSMRSRRLEEE